MALDRQFGVSGCCSVDADAAGAASPQSDVVALDELMSALAAFEGRNRLLKTIGNVGHDTTLTFKFGVLADVPLNGSVPFQVRYSSCF